MDRFIVASDDNRLCFFNNLPIKINNEWVSIIDKSKPFRELFFDGDGDIKFHGGVFTEYMLNIAKNEVFDTELWRFRDDISKLLRANNDSYRFAKSESDVKLLIELSKDCHFVRTLPKGGIRKKFKEAQKTKKSIGFNITEEYNGDNVDDRLMFYSLSEASLDHNVYEEKTIDLSEYNNKNHSPGIMTTATDCYRYSRSQMLALQKLSKQGMLFKLVTQDDHLFKSFSLDVPSSIIHSITINDEEDFDGKELQCTLIGKDTICILNESEWYSETGFTETVISEEYPTEYLISDINMIYRLRFVIDKEKINEFYLPWIFNKYKPEVDIYEYEYNKARDENEVRFFDFKTTTNKYYPIATMFLHKGKWYLGKINNITYHKKSSNRPFGKEEFVVITIDANDFKKHNDLISNNEVPNGNISIRISNKNAMEQRQKYKLLTDSDTFYKIYKEYDEDDSFKLSFVEYLEHLCLIYNLL